MNDELFVRRKNTIHDLCTRVENILSGYEYPLSKMVVIDGEFSSSTVVQIASDIVEKGQGLSELNKAISKSFFECAIAYLFSECNEDDRIVLSLFKLAKAFEACLDYQDFSGTTFGIMIDDAKSARHYSKIEEDAFCMLLHSANKLEELFVGYRLKGDSSLNLNALIEQYIMDQGLHCFDNDEKFNGALLELRRLMHRSKILTGVIDAPDRR